ncbi:MAG: hypothetical protein R3230_00420 [Nitrosopumilaceae archaeon]|nr:hypothetical protein [Nitrosopumilaceae archaeon]
MTINSNAVKTKKEIMVDQIRHGAWSNHDIGSLNSLHDTIQCFLFDIGRGDDIITYGMVKKVHYSLPYSIILEGVEWGYGDTEVRENVFKYLMDNKTIFDNEE